MSEFFDLDRPDGDDKRKHVYDADAAGWRIAAGHDTKVGLMPMSDLDRFTRAFFRNNALPGLFYDGLSLASQRRVELAGYPDGSE